jgi:hypothetical protein
MDIQFLELPYQGCNWLTKPECSWENNKCGMRRRKRRHVDMGQLAIQPEFSGVWSDFL